MTRYGKISSAEYENNIDRELRPFLREMPTLKEETSLCDIRKALLKVTAPWAKHTHNPNVVVENRKISSIDGSSFQIPIRIYRPRKLINSHRIPAFLWIHGGGFFLGSINNEDAICEKIVIECNCIVISVDYRLAPEYPYPAALDDCYAALAWLVTVFDELMIDSSRIAIGGSSAGGCLAAALALRVRDHGGPSLIHQTLLIPVIDNRHETPSSKSVTYPRVWNRSTSLKAWAAYLKNLKNEIPIYASPGRADDLSGLPPAFISVADQDLLRDEGILYAHKLMQAGVTTELHVYPGTFHGFHLVASSAVVSRKHERDMLYAINKAFHGD